MSSPQVHLLPSFLGKPVSCSYSLTFPYSFAIHYVLNNILLSFVFKLYINGMILCVLLFPPSPLYLKSHNVDECRYSSFSVKYFIARVQEFIYFWWCLWVFSFFPFHFYSLLLAALNIVVHVFLCTYLRVCCLKTLF